MAQSYKSRYNFEKVHEHFWYFTYFHVNASDKNLDEKYNNNSVICNDYGRITWIDWMNCCYGGDIAIFRFYCAEETAHPPDWRALLHPDEIERAWRYRRRDDRLRSLYSRSLLKILAGNYTNQNPLAIRLTTGLRNKPELLNNPEWHINAAHSGNWILLAIGKSSLGIDVEEVKPDFTFTDVIPFSFSSQERQYIGVDSNALLRFYELWTRKEAFVKAIGSGIDETFSQVPALTGFHKWKPAEFSAAGAWRIDSFCVAEGYPAAIAYSRSTENLQFYTLNRNIFASAT